MALRADMTSKVAQCECALMTTRPAGFEALGHGRSYVFTVEWFKRNRAIACGYWTRPTLMI
jgi:hypothetical protein